MFFQATYESVFLPVSSGEEHTAFHLLSTLYQIGTIGINTNQWIPQEAEAMADPVTLERLKKSLKAFKSIAETSTHKILYHKYCVFSGKRKSTTPVKRPWKTYHSSLRGIVRQLREAPSHGMQEGREQREGTLIPGKMPHEVRTLPLIQPRKGMQLFPEGKGKKQTTWNL